MRVFIWKSYGSSRAFRANDNKDLKHIFLTMYEILRDYGIEECYNENDIPLSNFSESDIYALIDAFGGESVHEIIEFGTEFTNLEIPRD